MALQTALSSPQLTAIRSDKYQALQYVCVVPNEVVVQFNPDSAPSTAVYAEITPDTPLSGSMSNIQQGQTVIYSTTADYQATEVFRTRVRKVSGTTTLYVGENSQSITTATYITVLNTYEIQEKLRKSETYADWDIPFRKLLPIETALPSAVVLSNGVTAYSPTATPQEMDSSATSTFTHAWASSNSNDTLDSGGTTNNPTFTLEAGSFRWIRYTFNDSNGNSNFRVIPVWTVPKNYDNPYVMTGFIGESGDVASISFDAELGWSATIPAYTGIAALINKTYTVIASDEWYNDTRQSIRTNIDFVGFLQNENTGTRGDETIGRLSETTFTVEGFGHQLARQNIATVRITRVTGTPTAWGQIQNPTPARMLTYHITEDSTLFHLCSMTIPDDDTDFVGDDLSITGSKALDDIRFITDVINAELQFDTNGKLDLCRNLNFLDDTARDAAAVAGTLSPSDVLDYAIEYDYSKTTSQLTMNGGAYNNTRDEYDLYEALAPAVARLGEGDPLEVGNQVLTTDSTESEALTEISERAANFFAYHNPTPTLRTTLKDEWHFIVPDIGSWWKFDIVLTDTARGRVFSTADRWQCVERSVSTNNETGRRQVTATFRHETQSTGAIIRARQILNNTNADIIYYPGTLAPFTGADLEYTDGRFFDGFDVVSNSEPNPPAPGCELGGFRQTNSDGWEATQTAETNETIVSTVRGAGAIVNNTDYNFATSSHSFSAVAQSGSGTPQGSYSGSAWVHADTVDQFTTLHRGMAIERTGLSLGTVTKVRVTYDYTQGTLIDASPTVAARTLTINGNTVASNSYNQLEDGTDIVWEWTGSVSSVTSIGVRIDSDVAPDTEDPQTVTGSVAIKRIEINDTTYGDCFYRWTGTLETPDSSPSAYAAGFGLQYRDDDVPSIPAWNPEHQYEFTQEADPGGAIYYNFVNPFGTGQGDNWSIQIEVCFLDDV